MSWVKYTAALLWLEVASINAKFCDWDACAENEYCCGDNKCCSKTSDTFFWYLIIGVSIAVILCIWTVLFSAFWIEAKNFVFSLLHREYSSHSDTAKIYKENLAV